MIKEPYKIIGDSLLVNIDGHEEIEVINPEDLNIQYLICTGVKTQAQVQNMLFSEISNRQLLITIICKIYHILLRLNV